MDPRQQFHEFVDELQDELDKPALHAVVDHLPDELVSVALERMRALRARLPATRPLHQRRREPSRACSTS
jgi:hypothetical protein